MTNFEIRTMVRGGGHSVAILIKPAFMDRSVRRSSYGKVLSYYLYPNEAIDLIEFIRSIKFIKECAKDYVIDDILQLLIKAVSKGSVVVLNVNIGHFILKEGYNEKNLP